MIVSALIWKYPTNHILFVLFCLFVLMLREFFLGARKLEKVEWILLNLE